MIRAEFSQLFHPVATYCEINGVGDVFYEILGNDWINEGIPGKLESWLTTNQSKASVIEKLITDFNTRNISIPNDKTLLGELGIFEASYTTKTRAIQYAARGGGHDDTVMSLAICNFHAHKAALMGNYYLN